MTAYVVEVSDNDKNLLRSYANISNIGRCEMCSKLTKETPKRL